MNMTHNNKKNRLLFFSALCIFSRTALPAQSASAPKINAPAAPVSAEALWTQELGDTVIGTPHLQASSVVLATGGGSIQSYFMSGMTLWNFDSKKKAAPFIARSYEGISYVCGTDGIFMAVNRVGRELWQLNLGKPVSFAPLIGWDGRVFIPVDSRLICRTASGNSLWSLYLGSPLALPPVLDHAGSLVTALQNQEFVRINQFSTVERIKLDRLPVLIVPLKEGASGQERHSYVLLYQNGEAEKIIFNSASAKDRQLSRSRFASLPGSPAAASGSGNQCAVTLRDGRVLCLDGADGAVLWTKNSHETTAEKGSGSLAQNQAAMLFDERGIYTITTRGVTGFAANGRRRFIFKYGFDSGSIPGLSDEGLLYVCGKDNRLSVYKLDGKPRTIPRSRYYGPEPEGSYGMGSPPPSPWANETQRYEDARQEELYAMIERVIRSGQAGENEPAYAGYLIEMIGFFLDDPHYSPARPRVKPPMRVKMIRLLGLIGSRETVPFLWLIFDRDREPSVKSACAEAIGAIGIDPAGRSFESYNFLLAANNPNRDPQILLSATVSIARLCRYVGPPLTADGLRLLRRFTNLSWAPNTVKAQIQNEINALGREGLDRVLQ